jgi:DNA-binding sugar fermentation-stimulating protein
MPSAGYELAIPAFKRLQTCALGRGYIEARTDTTQQSGQTPDYEVEIKNITVYVSGYTETPDSRER